MTICGLRFSINGIEVDMKQNVRAAGFIGTYHIQLNACVINNEQLDLRTLNNNNNNNTITITVTY